MQANRFDRAAEAPILNTYVPINFGELYRIGAAQKQAVDEAAQQFSTQLQKFGEFRSPSTVDTQKWYDLTVNRKDIQDAVRNIVANPDYLKDAANRANIQALINNTDYSSLSLLKESANNLRAGLEMRAKMLAEGKYKESWDDANITGYDTLGTNKVFDQITPLRYMTADELSNPYFSNLKPSSIGSVWKDGVKYNRTGITYDTLLGIADAKFNDLVSTPQGQQYYKEALAANNGDANAARQAFVGMIADSQRDRIVNQDTVDPYWLIMAKQRISNSGNEEIIKPNPTRVDFLNTSIERTTKERIGNRFPKYMNMLNEAANSSDAKTSTKAKKDIADVQNYQIMYADAAEQANAYYEKYKRTKNQEDYNNAVALSTKAKLYRDTMLSASYRPILDEEFKSTAGFSSTLSSDSKEFVSKNYIKGVNAALDAIKADVGLMDKDDLLSGVGAYVTEIQNSDGTKHQGYQFNNSAGFLLPETVFNMASGNKEGRTIKRQSGIFRDSDFPFKELVESGAMGAVQFIPDNKMLKSGPGDIALSGKLRISKENVEKALGTGIWNSTLGYLNAMYIPFGRTSTESNLKKYFNASEIEEVVGENGVEYYEIDAYRILPNQYTAPEYWHRVNQKWQNSPSHGGIGGTAQAKEEYYTSAEQLLGE